jgi:hypothetical protein
MSLSKVSRVSFTSPLRFTSTLWIQKVGFPHFSVSLQSTLIAVTTTEIIEPAVQGTLGIVKSIKEHG